MHPLQRLGQPLVVLRQAAEPRRPTERAFHDPPPWQEDEPALRLGQLHDLQIDPLVGRGDLRIGAGVALVDVRQLKAMGRRQPERDSSLVSRPELKLQAGEVDDFGHVRLGGIGQRLADEIEARTGYEARMTALGHVLRGGTPSAYDRVIATRFGIEAIDAAHENDYGKMVALRGTDVVRIAIEEGVDQLKTVDGRLFETAAVFFG